MFDYVMERINALIASGAATWDDAIAQIQGALDTASRAYDAHMSIMDESYASGNGAEWAGIELRLDAKLSQLRTLAYTINLLLPGETIHGLNAAPAAAALPPAIAGLSVGMALLLLGSLYIVSKEATEFFLKITGKMPPDAPGSVETLAKFGIIAAVAIMLLPQIIGSRKK